MRMKIALRRDMKNCSQRGLGLVELMVGITVGLIVTAGAAVVATRQITEHRRLMLEVQIQQDLRIAADLLQQDIRRAGFRGLPLNGVWEPERNGGAIPPKPSASSPYTEITLGPAGKDIYYRYARAPAGSTVVNASNVVANNEYFGVRLSNKTLYLQIGLVNDQPNWQPLTDPEVVSIDDFAPAITNQQVSLADFCECPAGTACPTLTVRNVSMTIKATAKADANVKRTLVVNERIRADGIDGVCP